MDVIKYAAQDLLELITGHPSNIKKKPSTSRPSIQRLSLNDSDLGPRPSGQKRPSSRPTSAPPSGSKTKKLAKPGAGRATAPPVATPSRGGGKSGSSGKGKENEKVEGAARMAKLSSQKTKEEDLKKKLASNKAKKDAREKENEKEKSRKSGSSSKEKSSSKTAGSGSVKKPSGSAKPRDNTASLSQKVAAANVSKRADGATTSKSKTMVAKHDQTIIEVSTEFNRQLGDPQRSYIQGMEEIPEADEDDGSCTVVPAKNGSNSGAGSRSKSGASSSKPSKLSTGTGTSESKARTSQQDATITVPKTTMGRQLGNNVRTVLDGMQSPSVVAVWQKGSTRKIPSKVSGKPTPKAKDATILPDKTAMKRQLGDNNRTVFEGMQTDTVVQKWWEEEEEARDPVLPPDPKSENDRQLGDMNRTTIEGMVTGSRMKILLKDEAKDSRKK